VKKATSTVKETAAKATATKTGAVWFTTPAVDALRIPAVEVPKFDLPKMDVPFDLPKVDVVSFATEAKDKVQATAADVRKNVSHTVVLLREVVGV